MKIETALSNLKEIQKDVEFEMSKPLIERMNPNNMMVKNQMVIMQSLQVIMEQIKID